MRRRLRERRREREARLLDLGALVYELHRQGKRAPELLQEKAAELALVDEEVRELEAALDGEGAAPAAPLGDAYEGDEAAQTEEADALDEEPGEEPTPDEDSNAGSAPREGRPE
jgi:hypothetical protein